MLIKMIGQSGYQDFDGRDALCRSIPTTIDKHEPLSARRIFTQVSLHSGRQSVEGTPHVGGLGA